jgi:Spy/CpxP family protein refolding chaperone
MGQRQGPGRGIAGSFLRAARDLADLKDPQKAALDKVTDGLKSGSDGDAMKTEMKSFHDDMMAGVKAGKLDQAKLTAHYAAMDKLGQTRSDKEADALNGVYAALDANQRKALTAAVRANQAKRDEKAKAWMAAHDGGAPADWTKKRLDKMTADLGLDADQQKKVGDLLGKQMKPGDMDAMRDAGKKRMEAILAAFEKDGFDAKKQDLSMMPGKKPHDMIQQQVDFTNALLGILKPDQRDKLAASMDKKPGDGAPERMGGGGPWAEGQHDDD